MAEAASNSSSSNNNNNNQTVHQQTGLKFREESAAVLPMELVLELWSFGE